MLTIGKTECLVLWVFIAANVLLFIVNTIIANVLVAVFEFVIGAGTPVYILLKVKRAAK
jgi:hypothetical protein